MFNNKRIHFIGIGGVSMSGIAQILKSCGATITGYDMQSSIFTEKLESLGIKVSFEPNLKNIDEADIVVYTAAIHEDNEELAYARELNKETYERAVFLGLMMKEYENVICISGTHGKSTTTGMVSTIFVKCNMDPTIQLGATLPLIGGNERVGSHKYFIAEACEYVDSFLSFFPTAEIILNIDNDHLDYFKNLDNIKKSFTKYTNLLPDNGYLVINADDKNTVEACGKNQNIITFGINNDAKYMAKDISYDEYGHGNYDLYVSGKKISRVYLSISGIHNIYNSLAAIALSNQYIDDLDSIIKALKDYTGVGRRFELLGKYNGALVYDDYAHHPSEIMTTYDSVQKTKHNHTWAIFQSHTYSRTYDHLEEFAEVLSKFENVVIAKIYPAREENVWNVKEEELVRLIKEKGNNNVIYIDDFEKIEEYIKDHAQEGDLVITIGAGPINKVAINLCKKQSE